ncbi:RNA polymerase sigma-70 factor [Halopseudomonas phragmitis]|uniref:RNA polymerase subunit sigma-24 n=1 Tax=Halopseudomonas phragmitis TaxID=1931241 RepID=A0A1V0B7R0_9GAMM|nr:RNA polymerase sigma-70 factor [Halopseudomonas phragmitis]AQZ95966.1 RNA polymerase subunit sigma-24 [Halopseudomonas phragmitis]
MNDKAELFDQARPRLLGLGYRLLGTRMDAEDLVQDAWFRWSEADHKQIADPQAWLVTVVTRLGIDRLRQLKRRREEYSGPWLPEPVFDDMVPGAERLAEMASDLSMAFLLAMERLSAQERAAFLLREVFDYSYDEIAAMIGKSPVASRQAISRARARLRDERPRFDVDPAAHRQLLERFVAAMAQGDAKAFASLLAEEVRWIADGGGRVRAASRVLHGVRAATRLAMGLQRSWRDRLEMRLALINGQTGVLLLLDGQLRSVVLLESDGRAITGIYSVVNPDKLRGASGSYH